MHRRMSLCLVVLLAAPLAVLAPVRSAVAADDDEPLEFTGTFTYTPDIDAGVVHVSAYLNIRDLGKSKPGYCWDGFYLPVPASATNFFNVAAVLEEDGQLGETTSREVFTSPIEGFPELMEALVMMRGCISGGHRSHTTLEFDIPAGDPRSPNPVRINTSYIGFEALAMGRPTGVTIQVVLPAEFALDHLDEHWTARTSNGITTYSLSPAAQVEHPDVFIGARNDSEMVGIPVDADTGQLFNVMYWPNDARWGKFVAAQVERGVPALTEAVGVDWPIDGETQVREAYSNYFDGYAGWFDPTSNQMEIGDNLDQVTIFHELSHAWFNDNWFSERWLREGFAETYAADVLQQLGVDSAEAEAVSPTEDGAVALELWEEPSGSIEGTDDLEQYGYTASYHVVSELVDEIGMTKMREVLRMVDSGETIYTGDGEPELWNADSSWKDLLDLLEDVGGSTKARDLMVRFVIEDGGEAILDDRDKARTAYAALDERSGDWASPIVVRKRLDDWSFSDFDTLTDTTNDVLDVRDQLAQLTDDLGIDLPAEVEDAYERAASRAELEDAKALAEDYLDALHHLSDASDAKNGSHGIFGTIGLIASDADSELQAALDAFADGDLPATIEHSDKVVSIVDDATGQGLLRLGILLLLILLAIGLVWFLRRRKALTQSDTEPAADSVEAQAIDPVDAD